MSGKLSFTIEFKMLLCLGVYVLGIVLVYDMGAGTLDLTYFHKKQENGATPHTTVKILGKGKLSFTIEFKMLLCLGVYVLGIVSTILFIASLGMAAYLKRMKIEMR